LQTFISKNRK